MGHLRSESSSESIVRTKMLWKNNNMNETFTYIKILYNSDKLIYSVMQEMKQQAAEAEAARNFCLFTHMF